MPSATRQVKGDYVTLRDKTVLQGQGIRVGGSMLRPELGGSSLKKSKIKGKKVRRDTCNVFDLSGDAPLAYSPGSRSEKTSNAEEWLENR